MLFKHSPLFCFDFAPSRPHPPLFPQRAHTPPPDQYSIHKRASLNFVLFFSFLCKKKEEENTITDKQKERSSFFFHFFSLHFFRKENCRRFCSTFFFLALRKWPAQRPSSQWLPPLGLLRRRPSLRRRSKRRRLRRRRRRASAEVRGSNEKNRRLMIARRAKKRRRRNAIVDAPKASPLNGSCSRILLCLPHLPRGVHGADLQEEHRVFSRPSSSREREKQ